MAKIHPPNPTPLCRLGAVYSKRDSATYLIGHRLGGNIYVYFFGYALPTP